MCSKAVEEAKEAEGLSCENFEKEVGQRW